nr:hypothetical protein [uncultured Nitrososphaera sp.]
MQQSLNQNEIYVSLENFGVKISALKRLDLSEEELIDFTHTIGKLYAESKLERLVSVN